MSRTKGTIVLIGPTTYASDSVLWRIAETACQGHFMLGVQINHGKTHRIPVGLSASNVIRCNFGQIAKRLATWR
ncbi:TIR domain-containing protein [Nostocoides sp. HKS02]|uniref:TIR domain-containing protein n=1 Tax=Nostocoides sp. HKS02 TaxID=1813880 RepID=UPI00351B99BB